MRRLIYPLAIAAFAVVLVAAATATTSKTVAVSITNTGFVPKTVSILVGDSVKWTNTSTQNQQVTCAKCPFTSPVLSPGSSYTYTFKTAGKYPIDDPLHTNISGSVTATSGPRSLTLAASPRTVKYGGSTLLSGTISSGKSGQKVRILSEECGQSGFTHTATATTVTAGKYSITQKPSMNTAYQAKWSTASKTVSVHVRPSIDLRTVGKHRFRVRVKAAKAFIGKQVLFQKRTAAGRWVKVKRVKLKTAATVGATTTTKATFKSRIRQRKKVRILMKSGQVAPCYVGGHSNVIRS